VKTMMPIKISNNRRATAISRAVRYDLAHGFVAYRWAAAGFLMGYGSQQSPASMDAVYLLYVVHPAELSL
jgi:hypothetical protein